ncbi:MAG: hypothetical protein A2563_04405 [Candidatus Magasanikbacteria bacterium RIFOXYD1_FULL_40_23]|uniref:Glycosyltransferase n=1 Tax=Candidatus Magasanikbacteria bacterium RIFOXYD1_FULL_40_23 TaxID=1798705 RepID=A0A1F6P9T8_9BACT|nr:MAG: hypothetical protein A2563_04405 [Candidatus Magasanikbacteria bacterium RIFOXYD1_FULL_40_23]
MKIAVNTRMLLKDRLDGIGRFAYHTLSRITKAHPEVEFVFLFDRKFSDEFIFSKNVTPMVIPPPTRHPFLYYLWFQISVKLALKKIKPDLFLSPDGLLPLGAQCKQLAVIHDINFKHYPEDLKFWTGKFFNYYFPKYAFAANRIVTVSEYTKKDLMQEYRTSSDKIDVVYNAADEIFAPITAEEKRETRQKYSKGEDYFVFIGSVSPRKNIGRLMEAFDLFKKENKNNLKLIIAGANFWGQDKLNETLNKLEFKNDIIFTGRVDDNEMRLLLGSAFCLTYIPYFEGFGVPLVEAMRAHVPIISSSLTSMPEIAGGAAVFVNPFQIQEVRDAMVRITADESLRHMLIEKGKIQCQKFSWDKSAADLWKSIEKTLAE